MIQLAVLLLSAASLASSEIIQLTDENFLEITRQEPALLILFSYHDENVLNAFCPLCNETNLAFEEAEETYRGAGSAGKFAYADCYDAKGWCGEFATWIPIIRYFVNGKPDSNYRGPVTGADIVDWMYDKEHINRRRGRKSSGRKWRG